jgi:hypothetical protein
MESRERDKRSACRTCACTDSTWEHDPCETNGASRSFIFLPGESSPTAADLIRSICKLHYRLISPRGVVVPEPRTVLICTSARPSRRRFALDFYRFGIAIGIRCELIRSLLGEFIGSACLRRGILPHFNPALPFEARAFAIAVPQATRRL